MILRSRSIREGFSSTNTCAKDWKGRKGACTEGMLREYCGGVRVPKDF